MKIYLTLAIAVILGSTVISQSRVAWSKASDTDVSESELASVWGAQAERGLGCVKYFDDWENWSWDCSTPYLGADNDCDWKMCAGSVDATACGEGTFWSGLVEASWIATGDVGNTGFSPRSSPCTGIIDCAESNPDETMSCKAGVLRGSVMDPIPPTAGQGCFVPPETQEDPAGPTGCTTCSAGMPKPYNAKNVDWIWYKALECPTPLDEE